MCLRHWPVLLTLIPAFFVPLLAGLTRDAQSVAILVPTRTRLDAAIRLVAEADGEILSIAASHILLARSDRTGFASRLRALGAWFVLPASSIGCSGNSPLGTNPSVSNRASP